MLRDFDALPEDPSELRAVSKLLAAEVKSQALMIEKLKHQLAGHNRHRFGSKSESLDQLNLAFAEEEEIAEAAEKQAAPSPDSTDADKPARQHSRKPLPDHLDRHEEVLSPGDDCNRCGGSLKTLGEDVTEELEYVPGRFVVNRIVRPRMACSCCEAICQAPLPSRPIERGRPGPGLLAHVLVSKYADHLPLYRQSQIYAREGIDLDRSTMADWVGRSTALLEPLADAIGRVVRGGDALFADDTPVKMQAPGNKKTKIARVWTYVRDERPWAGQSPPCAWYQFTIDRKGEHPVSHLSGYRGWVHADGYSGFNGVFGADKAREMACLAHVRRKFVDMHAAQGSAIAEEAIRRIAKLYGVEKEARGRRARTSAASAQSAIVITIGIAVPSKNGPASMIITPPVSICSVPPSEDARPAISPCSSSAITIVVGITRPRQALAQNSMPTTTARLAKPANAKAAKAQLIIANPRTANNITRTMPKRSPNGAAICEAEKKPTALIAKARLNPVGERPNWPV